jgi:hypothetical protein
MLDCSWTREGVCYGGVSYSPAVGHGTELESAQEPVGARILNLGQRQLLGTGLRHFFVRFLC